MVWIFRFINSKIVAIAESKKKALCRICINFLHPLSLVFPMYEIAMVPPHLFTCSYLEEQDIY